MRNGKFIHHPSPASSQKINTTWCDAIFSVARGYRTFNLFRVPDSASRSIRRAPVCQRSQNIRVLSVSRPSNHFENRWRNIQAGINFDGESVMLIVFLANRTRRPTETHKPASPLTLTFHHLSCLFLSKAALVD